jgi:diguanylate cyclase (GGDEF)-like protein
VVFDRGHIMYRDGKAVRMIGSMMDITKRKKGEEELRHGAHHDPLTGLANRTLLLQELERTLARGRRREGSSVGLLFLDLDGFKAVNDTLGHIAGDQLLTEVARVLRECVRPSDVVARLGGDEFTVILTDLHSKEDADAVAARILGRLQEPVQVRAGSIHTGASIGIALTAGRSVIATDLLHEADAAMYKAKAGGKNRYEFYTPDQP